MVTNYETYQNFQISTDFSISSETLRSESECQSSKHKSQFWSSFLDCQEQIYKPGHLDSRDQSRSRTSLVSRPTFLKCRNFLDSRDQLFFSRSRFLKSRLFNRNLAVSRFLSRLSKFSRFSRFVEIFEICWDFSRFINISPHYRDFLRYFRIKNLDREIR